MAHSRLHSGIAPEKPSLMAIRYEEGGDAERLGMGWLTPSGGITSRFDTASHALSGDTDGEQGRQGQIATHTEGRRDG